MKRGIVPLRKRFSALGMTEGSWALADQGVMSLGSFITNVLLARSLPPAEYGIFSLIYGIVFLLSSVHGSLIIYPLSIHGASATDDELRLMLGRSLLLTLFVGAAASPIIAGALWAVGRIGLLLWALAVFFAWQIQQTVRRGLMTHQRFQEAFWGDSLCNLGQAALIWLLSKTEDLNLVYTFAVIAATSLLAASLQAHQLRPRFEPPFSLWNTAADFWPLGRWVLLINLLVLPVSQVFPWLLMFMHGAQDVAAYQAVTNILAGANPVIFCMGNLMLPISAKAHALDGVQSAWRMGRVYATQGGVLLMPYFFALLFWPGWFLRIFYGQESAYSGLTSPLRILIAAAILHYLAQMIDVFLNSIKEGRLAFLAQAAGASTVLLAGPPLVLWAGVLGAAGAHTVVNGVKAAFSVAFLSQKLKCEPKA